MKLKLSDYKSVLKFDRHNASCIKQYNVKSNNNNWSDGIVGRVLASIFYD